MFCFVRRAFAAGNTCTTHGSGTGNTLLGPRGVPQAQTQRGLRRRPPWPARCLLAPGSRCPRHMQGMPPVGGVQMQEFEDATRPRTTSVAGSFLARLCGCLCSAHTTTHTVLLSPLLDSEWVVVGDATPCKNGGSRLLDVNNKPQRHNTTTPQQAWRWHAHILFVN